MITGAAFVDLSAAYDTVNHRILKQKIFNTTRDSLLYRVIQNMLSSWIFYVELNDERSRWRKQKNGSPQGSVLSPVLFNIYINDQPIFLGTRSFIYADYLCVTAQYPSFTEVEETIEDVREEITQYYRSNSMRANPDKTQVTSFYIRNKEAKISLKVKWSNTELENMDQPKYLGVLLDRTLSYKQHIHNTKMKVATHNNLLRKLANTKWSASASTIKTTALALCYSVAEYAAPVWTRSYRTHVLDSELNTACRAVTGCLKPTNIEDLYLLVGIAPPDIRRDVYALVDKMKQKSNVVYSLYGQTPTESCLKYRSCFLSSVRPANLHPKVIRFNEWQRRLNTKPHSCRANLTKSLARGHTSQWTTWRCLHRLSTRVTCSKEQWKKWVYEEGYTTCDCGVSSENTRHMLECLFLAHSCSLDDLLQFNETVCRTMEDSGLMTR